MNQENEYGNVDFERQRYHPLVTKIDLVVRLFYEHYWDRSFFERGYEDLISSSAIIKLCEKYCELVEYSRRDFENLTEIRDYRKEIESLDPNSPFEMIEDLAGRISDSNIFSTPADIAGFERDFVEELILYLFTEQHPIEDKSYGEVLRDVESCIERFLK
jgi:hypothetical protein